MTIFIDQIFKKIEPYLGLPLLIFEFVAFLIYVPIKSRLGFANLEAYGYIPSHLNLKGSLIAHAFNQKLLDNWGFQNRNLSYVVDYFDAQIIGWSLRMGYPHFLSIFHFICVGIIVFSLWFLFQRILELDRGISFLLCTLLLLAPSLQVSDSYMRSSKSGAGVEVMIFAIFSLALIFNRKPIRWWTIIFFWLSGFIFSFFDFMSVAMCIYFGIISVFFIFLQERKLLAPRIRFAALFFLSILLFNQLFGRFAVPAIYEHYYGEHYFFAPAPIAQTIKFIHNPFPWFAAIFSMCVDQIRLYLGTYPYALAILGVFYLLYASHDFLKRKFGKPLAAYALTVILIPIIGIWLLLRLAHEPIFHEVFRRLYYPVPFQVLIAVGAGVFLRECIKNYGSDGLRTAKIILWLAILGSLSSIDGHFDVFRGSYMNVAIADSPKILAGLHTYVIKKDDSSVPEEIRHNGLYTSLKKYYDENK